MGFNFVSGGGDDPPSFSVLSQSQFELYSCKVCGRPGGPWNYRHCGSAFWPSIKINIWIKIQSKMSGFIMQKSYHKEDFWFIAGLYICLGIILIVRISLSRSVNQMLLHQFSVNYRLTVYLHRLRHNVRKDHNLMIIRLAVDGEEEFHRWFIFSQPVSCSIVSFAKWAFVLLLFFDGNAVIKVSRESGRRRDFNMDRAFNYN